MEKNKKKKFLKSLFAPLGRALQCLFGNRSFEKREKNFDSLCDDNVSKILRFLSPKEQLNKEGASSVSVKKENLKEKFKFLEKNFNEEKAKYERKCKIDNLSKEKNISCANLTGFGGDSLAVSEFDLFNLVEKTILLIINEDNKVWSLSQEDILNRKIYNKNNELIGKIKIVIKGSNKNKKSLFREKKPLNYEDSSETKRNNEKLSEYFTKNFDSCHNHKQGHKEKISSNYATLL